MSTEFEIIRILELEISGKEVRASSTRLAELLHDDFEEFGKSGKRFNKSSIVEELPVWDYQKIEVSCFECVSLSKESVLTKYQSLSNGVKANRSSIWVKENNSWQMIFHQGTVCEKET